MTSIDQAKESLKRILRENDGDPSHPSVQHAIASLQTLAQQQRQSTNSAQDKSPEVWDATHDPKPHSGKWRMINAPSFSGRLSDDSPDGKSRYTLGRMAFNLFKPTKLVCCIDEICNVVQPDESAENTTREGEWTQSYNLEVIMEIEVPSSNTTGRVMKLPAKLVNYGMCTPASTPCRLSVKFIGGMLQPNFDMNAQTNIDKTCAWREVFEGAIAKGANGQSMLQNLVSGVSNVLMKVMMGLTPPVDSEELTQTYSIARPIAGYLDILYLDEDLRVSRGNRGAVVIVERV